MNNRQVPDFVKNQLRNISCALDALVNKEISLKNEADKYGEDSIAQEKYLILQKFNDSLFNILEQAYLKYGSSDLDAKEEILNGFTTAIKILAENGEGDKLAVARSTTKQKIKDCAEGVARKSGYIAALATLPVSFIAAGTFFWKAASIGEAAEEQVKKLFDTNTDTINKIKDLHRALEQLRINLPLSRNKQIAEPKT